MLTDHLETLKKLSLLDENKNEYYVGAHAQNDVKVTDSNNSTAALYVRDRWSSPETKVITRVGLALGMMKNQFNDPSGKMRAASPVQEVFDHE